jgi:hypothetical protein
MKDPPRERARSRIRQERLARALRENLRRRKIQARERRSGGAPDGDACNQPAEVPISDGGESKDGGERG